MDEYTKQSFGQPHKAFAANVFPKIVHTDIVGKCANTIFITEYQALISLSVVTCKDLYGELIRKNYSEHHSAQKWEEKFVDTEIDWSKVWTSVCNPVSTENTKSIIWEQIHLNDYCTYSYNSYFYLQKNGVPDGGSLCVQLANITVFYLMHKAVYSKPNLMINVKEAKRYIDDGAGFYTGSERSFAIWMNAVNHQLNPYGLHIDESTIKDINQFAPFLDIQFCFDFDGNLQTDLYVKPTDARSYLNFKSAHPQHVFPGIVYSQCLRLRRIINDNDRLKLRLEELCSAFGVSHKTFEKNC